MSLNIKNEETCRLAGELARLTGETMTGAITVALRERLERVGRTQDEKDARYQRIMEISREMADLPDYAPWLGLCSTATSSTMRMAYRVAMETSH